MQHKETRIDLGDGVQVLVRVPATRPLPRRPRPRPTFTAEAQPLTDWEPAEDDSSVQARPQLRRCASVVVPLRRAA